MVGRDMSLLDVFCIILAPIDTNDIKAALLYHLRLI